METEAAVMFDSSHVISQYEVMTALCGKQALIKF